MPHLDCMSEGGPRGGGAESALRVEAGSDDSYVPRTVSPTRTLALLANSGDDLSSRHGTVTTTDWGMLTEEECDACVAENEMVYLFDADNTGSVDIICNNCCGLGHIARVCRLPAGTGHSVTLWPCYSNSRVTSERNRHVGRRVAARGRLSNRSPAVFSQLGGPTDRASRVRVLGPLAAACFLQRREKMITLTTILHPAARRVSLRVPYRANRLRGWKARRSCHLVFQSSQRRPRRRPSRQSSCRHYFRMTHYSSRSGLESW